MPSELREATVELLGELIRHDTVNPPGNERELQGLLALRLAEAGFECELMGAEPERPNLVARLGDGEGPTLALLGHCDTVPARSEEWSFDPWSGELSGGEVRGRGAQDMKGQVAAEVAAAIALGRSGWRPEGELLVICTADEERGALGAEWLCTQRPDAVRADYVINEGGGASFEVGGRRFHSLCVGEKGIFRFRLRAHGRPGHASTPGLGDNALLKLAPALAALADQPPLDPTPEGLAFLAATLGRELGPGPELDAVLAELAGEAPEVASFLAEPMLRVTLVPTRAHASDKDNVTPSVAELLVDCRVPPEMGEPEVRERIASVLGADHAGLELELVNPTVGNRSPLDTRLSVAIGEWLAASDPEATLVPVTLAGFSDSNWFRTAFDSAIVYGFCPQREMGLLEAAPLIHGIDERASANDLGLAASFYTWIARELLG
ncbi:MAG: M20/M25/M40 family metallo-hydrolase [Solirubrobacterales bacterium]|nr:M20/M25/M40 family metallo-hydrolase [Solirubrobacterales bacterium]